MVLLFDVLHYYYFSDEEERMDLLSEIGRILLPDGILSLYPKHLESDSDPTLDEVMEELEDGFVLVERIEVTMIHEEVLDETTVLNFRAKGKGI
jgi:hypothetical protein